jgi:hypothetical protein
MTIQIGSDSFRNAMLFFPPQASSLGQEFAGNILVNPERAGRECGFRNKHAQVFIIRLCQTATQGKAVTMQVRQLLLRGMHLHPRAETWTLTFSIWLAALGSEVLRDEPTADVMSRQDSFHTGHAQGNLRRRVQRIHACH